MILEVVNIPIPEECLKVPVGYISIDQLLNRENWSTHIECSIEDVVEGRLQRSVSREIQVSIKGLMEPSNEKFLLQDNKILQLDEVYLWPKNTLREVDKLLLVLEGGVYIEEISLQIIKYKKPSFQRQIIKRYNFDVRDFLEMAKWVQVAYFGGFNEALAIPWYETSSVERLERIVKLLGR